MAWEERLVAVSIAHSEPVQGVPVHTFRPRYKGDVFPEFDRCLWQVYRVRCSSLGLRTTMPRAVRSSVDSQRGWLHKTSIQAGFCPMHSLPRPPTMPFLRSLSAYYPVLR